ncbi:transcriptional regulator [Idiomarina xiamenensis 10-D-4]|uniref:Type III pantothenate kinase n=1 Tax=Idiomarina xiamenensis 10-D-4 TaxID=740709 RepID=K2KMT0_9GAMM|nr:transcriptional regulator [Idiomarina xiamenensis 10-D-4]
MIDSGNSRSKVALADHQGILVSDIMSSEQLAAGDVLSWCQSHDYAIPSYVLASHVSQPQTRTAISRWAQPLTIHWASTHAQQAGVTNAYQQWQTLGCDRWLTLLAAQQRSQGRFPSLIVDTGTALTIDWLDSHGQHLGGWIIPGFELMRDAVLARAPGVFIDSDSSRGRATAPASNTSDGLLNGCQAAQSGVVRQALAVTAELPAWQHFRVLLCGGNHQELLAVMPDNTDVVPDLVIHGLQVYAEDLRLR